MVGWQTMTRATAEGITRSHGRLTECSGAEIANARALGVMTAMSLTTSKSASRISSSRARPYSALVRVATPVDSVASRIS